jgi:hypothetical protein
MRALPTRQFIRDFCRVRNEAITVTDRGEVVGTWTPSPKTPKPINFEERLKANFKSKLPFTGVELLRGKKR